MTASDGSVDGVEAVAGAGGLAAAAAGAILALPPVSCSETSSLPPSSGPTSDSSASEASVSPRGVEAFSLERGDAGDPRLRFCSP